MAEDLTEYLHENGVRVRYMHSDIDTIERIEIIRDLRLGAFDALVGINLLREGLDIPECALVAILDADKEGFLRSETSLVQTIGRAARNVDGKVILYADVVTGSMQRAMEETNRRRPSSRPITRRNGITPASIRRGIQDILGSVYEADHVTVDVGLADGAAIGHNLHATIADLEKRMKEAAGNLEFEEAARLRDEIKRLQAVELAVGDDPLARQADVEATAGAYAGERPYGRAANMPSTRPRKPTDEDMGPHNWAAARRGRRAGRGGGGGDPSLVTLSLSKHRRGGRKGTASASRAGACTPGGRRGSSSSAPSRTGRPATARSGPEAGALAPSFPCFP